jgi:hypothetical protein
VVLAMVHTYPDDEFIPLAGAFEQVVTPSELCTAACQSIGSAATQAERDDAFERYDQAKRQIEKAMRTAIADGKLPVFRRASNNQIERIVDPTGFRHKSFGIPDIENIPHHLTSPGPDTDGQPVLLKKSDFHAWLSGQGADIFDLFHTGSAGKPSAAKLEGGAP